LSNERHEATFIWAEASAQCVSTDPNAILYLQRIKDFAMPATIRCVCVCVGLMSDILFFVNVPCQPKTLSQQACEAVSAN